MVITINRVREEDNGYNRKWKYFLLNHFLFTGGGER
jgi:hypothetical protein